MAGYVEKGIIRLHKKIAKDIWQMQIELPLTAREAKPGQFIHMKVNDPRYLLRRPISIAGTDLKRDSLKSFIVSSEKEQKPCPI